MIESYAISEIGGRSENQDRTLVDHSLGLFAVADGMGGHRSGALAAELAISTLRYYIESSQDRFDVSWPFGYSFEQSIDANRLATGIRLASRHVRRQAESTPQNAGMGTTVASLLLCDSTAVIGNVGDSRVYLFRQGNLSLLSQDDVAVDPQLDDGMWQESPRRQLRHVLSQAVGSQDSVDVHICERTIEPDDLFLLASDGLHGVVEEAAICSILGAQGPIQRAAERLMEAAMSRNGLDNFSVVVLGYSS